MDDFDPEEVDSAFRPGRNKGKGRAVGSDDDDDIDGANSAPVRRSGRERRPTARFEESHGGVDDGGYSEEEDDGGGPGGKSRDSGKKKRKAGDGQFAWEASYTRSWDVVQEDESGGLQAAVDGLLARGRKRRAQSNQSSMRRSIIRHVYILLDLSSSMREKDLRPDRFELTITYLRAFVSEWFDQNPLGQLGIIGLRDGLAEMVCEMGGNPHAIVTKLAEKKLLEPSGEPSLQNGLDMARGSMAHLPSTASLEVLVLFSSLTSADPGSIHKTLSSLITSRIRVSIISLAAELKICRTITEKTQGRFGVAMNEQHYRELIWDAVQAPATTLSGTAGLKSALDNIGRRADGNNGVNGGSGARAPPSDLMMMGFPTRLPLASPISLCACHSAMRRGGYLCPRCGSKVCEVPTDCEVCGLMVVSSPHLARSYWFLFPVPAYGTIQPEQEGSEAVACFGCEVPFPERTGAEMGVSHVDDGVSPTGRYRCPKCVRDYCMDCDFFIHDTLHSCPGCAGK